MGGICFFVFADFPDDFPDDSPDDFPHDFPLRRMAALPRWSRMPNAHPAPQVGDGLPFLLPSVPREGSAKLLDLSLCTRMPSTKGLCHQGQEGNALSPTQLLCLIHFLVIGMVQSMTSCLCSCWHGGSLEGSDNGDVHGSVLADYPIGHQYICWAAICAWQEKAPLFHWTQACCHWCLINCISEVIVAAYPLSTSPTAHCMVIKDITFPQAGWTRACSVKHWQILIMMVFVAMLHLH